MGLQDHFLHLQQLELSNAKFHRNGGAVFFRGGTVLDVVVYNSEKLLRQYKSTLYCIFFAIDLGLI